MRRLIILTLTAATAAIFAGCETTAPNTNNARNNVNNNANVNNMTVVPTNSNTNVNRWSNTNITREEYDKNRAEYEREKGTSTIGTGANDSWLWFKTRAALLATSDLRESTINVDVVNGVITLKGTVANAAQKKKAFDVANGIEGKTSVKDELKVAPSDSVTNMSTTDSDKKGNTNTKKQ